MLGPRFVEAYQHENVLEGIKMLAPTPDEKAAIAALSAADTGSTGEGASCSVAAPGRETCREFRRVLTLLQSDPRGFDCVVGSGIYSNVDLLALGLRGQVAGGIGIRAAVPVIVSLAPKHRTERWPHCYQADIPTDELALLLPALHSSPLLDACDADRAVPISHVQADRTRRSSVDTWHRTTSTSPGGAGMSDGTSTPLLK